MLSVNPLVNVAARAACTPRVPSLAAVVFFTATCALVGWATVHTWHRIETLRPLLARLTSAPTDDPFRGAGSTARPLILALAAPLPYLAPFASGCPRGVLLGFYATSFLAAVPLMNGFWMFTIIAVGLHRLGAQPPAA